MDDNDLEIKEDTVDVCETQCVDISGCSLPLVFVDGNESPHVCISDVFQAFFSTRHWGEFKAILEKNNVETVCAVSSSRNAFGVPEIVEAISVKTVEELLLSNQARRDGYVRCIRLNSGSTSTDESTTNFTSAEKLDGALQLSSVVAETKIILASERHVGELTSGIRTRHGDQSDLLYVELDGCTLPSIILNGVQYVRLVDVETKILSSQSTSGNDDPSNAIGYSLSKQLQQLKNVCARLKIDVQKCKQNEKARMVVYAKSYHSSSLHIIAASQLPRLVEYVRRHHAELKEKMGKRAAGKDGMDFSPARRHTLGGGERLSTPELKFFDSILRGGQSPSRPGSADTWSASSSGSCATTATLTAPPSPISTDDSSKKCRKRRSPSDMGVPKKPYKAIRALLEKKSDFAVPECTSPSHISNGHFKKMSSYSCQMVSSTKIRISENVSASFEYPPNDFREEPQQRLQEEEQEQEQEQGPSETPEISLVVDTRKDFELGRDESNVLNRLRASAPLAFCCIVLEKSQPLPVVVYNRRGLRGPAGVYYDHMFVSKNAPCVYCYGCREFYSLPEFVAEHTHGKSPLVPNPQLFMFVSNVRSAQYQLWKSLWRKAFLYDLKFGFNYRLPDDVCANNEVVKIKIDQADRQHSNTEKDSPEPMAPVPARTDNTAPPQQPVFGFNGSRRRQARGDALVDVMERYSSASYLPPVPSILGASSVEHEAAVEESFLN